MRAARRRTFLSLASIYVQKLRRFCRAELVAVVALVGDERFCWWQARIENFRTGMVAHLTFGQQDGEWLAVPVTSPHHVEHWASGRASVFHPVGPAQRTGKLRVSEWRKWPNPVACLIKTPAD